MAFEISDFTVSKGLVFCDVPSNAKNNAELLYLNEARKIGIDAVFFRRFYKENDSLPHNSEPAVCILEKSDNYFNSELHIELHAKLWSAGKNEIYIIKGKTRIDIINARKPAEVFKEGREKKQTIEPLLLAKGAIDTFDFKQYSAYLFETGTFWEQNTFKNKIDEQDNSYIYLLNHLMKVRKLLFNVQELDLKHETIDKLLITSILIKFLQEIKDDNGKHTLKSIYKKNNVEDFADAIDKQICLDILSELALEFNGKIFDKFSDVEKEKIQTSNLSLIADFLRANIDIDTKQLFLWEQYNFNYLPAEVISSIYENFIQAEANRQNGESEKGVVYTPIHLVNMLIDEVMPLNKPELFKDEVFKVLDPACGSGVFLVAAYKRLLQWWAINNSSVDNIQYPNSKKARKILEDNIFGVDVKHTATLVSVFGLTTALLDKLSPQEIWNKLKFSDLNEKNIQENNFFEWALMTKEKGWQFDLIIGNPPFNLETGKKKEDVLKPDIIKQLNFKHKNIPNNNLALHFFEGSMLFAKKVCLIIPANVVLYNKIAQEYRIQVFTDYNVDKIYDFTHLRESLFTKKSSRNTESSSKTGRTPVVVLFVENKPSERKPIEHTVVKRTILSEKKLRFEVDYYDRHYVKWIWAIDNTKSFIWKTNLLGGGRLFHLIYRLNLLDKLGDFILDKKKERGWEFNIGYIIGINKPKQAPYITNQDYVVGFDKTGEIKTQIEHSSTFEAVRNENLFKPPYLLVKDVVASDNIPTYLVKEHKNKYLAFKRNFTGISAPVEDYDYLEKIYSFIHVKFPKLYTFFILSVSASALVKQETYINKEDIESLPFPDDETYLNLSKTETLIQNDVLKYYIHLGKAITSNSAGSVLFQQVTQKQLEQFGAIFCDSLNTIYSRNNKSWQSGKIQQNNYFIIYQFGFGKNEGLISDYKQDFDKEVEALIEDKLSNSGVVYKKIIRFYSSIDGFDCVFLIKPNTMRYWLNSIALRDADDTFIDLKKAGF